MKRILLLAISLLVVMVSFGAAYKWVDEEGRVHYTDTPPDKQITQEIEIEPDPIFKNTERAQQELKKMRKESLDRKSTDDTFKKIKTISDVIGCWKRVNFPSPKMKNMNKSEPYPLEHQWYCFLEDGTYWDMHSNRINDDKSMKKKLKMMQIFPGYNYTIPSEGIIRLYHIDTKQVTYWVASTFSKDIKLWGVNMKRGDLLMTIRNPNTGKDIYYRFMKRVKL